MSVPRVLALVIMIPLLLFVAWRVYLLLRLRSTIKPTAAYWLAQQETAPQPGEFVYVALGDSAAQGIGASSYDKGYVALLAAQIQKATGRPVRVINLSVTGARVADVVREQLPRLKALHPDLVTLDIGANDTVKSTPDADFRRDFTSILEAIPAERSAVADLPVFSGKSTQSNQVHWNDFVQSEIIKQEIKLVKLSDTTRRTQHDWDTYAADFFHPSDKGYATWYQTYWPEVNEIISPPTLPKK